MLFGSSIAWAFVIITHMKVLAFDSIDWAEAESHGLTREKAIASIDGGLNVVKDLLPSLSDCLTIVVRPHFTHVIPEYGTGGYTYDSEFIEITFDSKLPYGLEATLKSLCETVFHEGNHAARYNVAEFDGRFINSIVTEGLATVFERDHAMYQPLYGQYEDDTIMHNWYKEISAGDWDNRGELMFEHPDGRKWVGYKTGTWLIDRAVKLSGKAVIELTPLPADEIISLAQIRF